MDGTLPLLASRRLGLWCVALLLAAADLPATTIVALVGGDSITLAADSVVIGRSRRTGLPAMTINCKIRCHGSVCTAASGRISGENPSYDIQALTDRLVRSAATLDEVASGLERALAPLLRDVVNRSSLSAPQEYRRWLAGAPVLSLTLAAVRNEPVPRVVNLEYLIDTAGALLPVRRTEHLGQPDRIAGLVDGQSEAVEAYLASHPGWREAVPRNPARAAVQFIRQEIRASQKAGRNDVGGPITVVRLDRNGFGVVPGWAGACLGTVEPLTTRAGP